MIREKGERAREKGERARKKETLGERGQTENSLHLAQW